MPPKHSNEVIEITFGSQTRLFRSAIAILYYIYFVSYVVFFPGLEVSEAEDVLRAVFDKIADRKIVGMKEQNGFHFSPSHYRPFCFINCYYSV